MKDKKAQDPAKKRKNISIAVLVIGLVALVIGIVFLVINLIAAARGADGEYLVSVGEWSLENEDGVVWKFTEIGKGTLTTNNHTNDYDFIWALEDGKMLVETDWLYDLENEYEYSLDQNSGVLTLKDGNKTYKFVKNR